MSRVRCYHGNFNISMSKNYFIFNIPCPRLEYFYSKIFYNFPSQKFFVNIFSVETWSLHMQSYTWIHILRSFMSKFYICMCWSIHTQLWQLTKTSSSPHGFVIGLKVGTHCWASWMAWSFGSCLILAFKEGRGIIVCWCHWSHPFYSRSLRHNNKKSGVAESPYQGMIDTGWWLFQICMSSHLV